ncbi:MAG TPA: metalloregulator ArsR/SmtB family transcription factor [Acidimicrobiales bacterium]
MSLPIADPGDEVFAALADPTRRNILQAVSEYGPTTATALTSEVPISRQAIARHLIVLREAGLVKADRTGRETRFVAQSQPLDDLAAWATATGRRWDDRLARLRDSLRN